ncbi:mechanosensitive ion channel family protein [Candidatus Woesearchaeota archaeon]|nr:MAG: mechanosensitive ion channel family protein [Candidatus Woesearchaeota archaeon]
MVDGFLLGTEALRIALIVGGAVVLAKLVHWISCRYFERWAKKTKSDIDDYIITILEAPVQLLIVLIGLRVALSTASFIVGYEKYVEGTFFVLAVALVAVVLGRLLAFGIARWLHVQKKFERTPRLIGGAAKATVYILAVLIVLDYFAIEITPLIAALGLGGLAVGLALQNTLTSFFAGMHIISDRPVNVGDFIEIEGNLSGTVEDIGWRSTRIRTLPNNIVVIPNAKLAESVIINDSLPEREMSTVVQVGVAYREDLEKVERVTIDVAKGIQKSVKGAVKGFEPLVRFHTFGDSNINFSVVLRIETAVDKYLVTHEFIKALKARYDKEGIEISWPVRKIVQG